MKGRGAGSERRRAGFRHRVQWGNLKAEQQGMGDEGRSLSAGLFTGLAQDDTSPSIPPFAPLSIYFIPTPSPLSPLLPSTPLPTHNFPPPALPQSHQRCVADVVVLLAALGPWLARTHQHLPSTSPPTFSPALHHPPQPLPPPSPLTTPPPPLLHPSPALPPSHQGCVANVIILLAALGSWLVRTHEHLGGLGVGRGEKGGGGVGGGGGRRGWGRGMEKGGRQGGPRRIGSRKTGEERLR